MNLVGIVATNVRNRRLILNITQEKLAEAIGCQSRYLQDVEAGSRANLTLVTLQRFSEALEIEPHLLLVEGGVGTPPHDKVPRGQGRSTLKRAAQKRGRKAKS